MPDNNTQPTDATPQAKDPNKPVSVAVPNQPQTPKEKKASDKNSKEDEIYQKQLEKYNRKQKKYEANFDNLERIGNEIRQSVGGDVSKAMSQLMALLTAIWDVYRTKVPKPPKPPERMNSAKSTDKPEDTAKNALTKATEIVGENKATPVNDPTKAPGTRPAKSTTISGP